MSVFLVMTALTSALHPSTGRCDRYVVSPGPEQGISDAALVRRASKHYASPRSLGTTLTAGDWRIIWAKPDDSEPGVFFFRGTAGHERPIDIWGGPTSDRAAAFRWAAKLGAPTGLARCFVDRLVDTGL